ncbi:MAG: acyl-CoA dehydrogenase family protein [Myxococcales bacterium]
MHSAFFEPTEAQALVRETARAYARDVLAPVAGQLDREQRFPASYLRELAGLGLMGVNVPEALGGAEAGAVAYALAMIELAQGCASTAVTVAVNNMVAETIVKFGSPELQRRFVPELTSGRFAAGSFGLSEPHCGSDAAALHTTARRGDGGWILNGSKQWITSGDQAGVIIVWARTSVAHGAPAKGLSCFLVEGGTPGLTIGRHEEKMGLRASSTVALAFEDVRVEESALLGAEGQGFAIAMSALQGGRIGIASQAVGIGTAAKEASLRYAKERRAFGKPIGETQAIRFMLADMETELSAARLLTLRAAGLKEAGLPFTREGSMAKVFASEKANRACDVAVQIHGGYGYIDEFPVERHYRDVRVTTIYEGTSEVQRLVISRDLLGR